MENWDCVHVTPGARAMYGNQGTGSIKRVQLVALSQKRSKERSLRSKLIENRAKKDHFQTYRKMANWKPQHTVFILLLLFRAALGSCVAAPVTDTAEEEKLSNVKTSIRLLEAMVSDILGQPQAS